jgi:hypothetical protein
MAVGILSAAMLLAASASGDGSVVDDAADVTPVVAVSAGLPIAGAVGQRIYCIEGYESGHYGGAVNRRSGAAGWLQWLPSTARQWGVVIGNRQSEWSAAARIAALGERFFRSQWVPLQLGWC